MWPFQSFTRRGGGGGLRGLDAKNESYHQPSFMSQYSHENMLDAKFKFGSFSSFGDMTSQKS